MIGMVDSKLIIFPIYYLLTSTSLYVLLQYYAILRESLPYTLYKLNYSYELRCATIRCDYRELSGLRKHPNLTFNNCNYNCLGFSNCNYNEEYSYFSC